MAHYITSLTFGSKLTHTNLPGNFNPLAKRDRLGVDAAESHDYTMKIVPTIFEDTYGNTDVSYQYTYAYSVITYFKYLNMYIEITEVQFITELCILFPRRTLIWCYMVPI